MRLNTIQESSAELIVGMNDLAELKSGQTITLSLPGCGLTRLVLKDAQAYSNGDFSLVAVGEIATKSDVDNPCQDIDLVLSKRGPYLAGSIRQHDRGFIVKDLGNDRLALWRASNELNEGCAGDEPPTRWFDTAPVEKVQQCCFVEILVLYDAAANASGDIESVIDNELVKLNSSLTSSRVFTCDLRFSIVDYEPYEVTNKSYSNLANDIADVQTNNAALRNTLDADLVIWITGDQNYTAVGQAIGLGSSDPNADAYAMMVLNANTITALTFAHEIGHLLQCQHERVNALFSTPYSHGYSFSYNGPRKTIMHTTSNPSERIMHFSNPVVKYCNKFTGNSSHNNAQQLLDEACRAAQFRKGQGLSLGVSGPNFACPDQYILLASDVQGDAPEPYSYVWEKSSSPFSGYTQFATSQNVFFDVGNFQNQLYVRLTVTASDGEFQQDIFGINEDDDCSGPIKSGAQTGLGSETDVARQVAVFPNPFRWEFRVDKQSLPLDTEARLIYEVRDVLGRPISIAVEYGNRFDLLRVSGTPGAGMYYLTVRNAKGQSVVIPVTKQ